MKKKFKSSVIVFIFTLFLIIGNAAAGTYLGDFCFNFSDSKGDSGQMKIGVSHIGGGHYTFSGRVVMFTDPVTLSIMGNIELINNQLVMVFRSSDADATDLYTNNGVVYLDRQSLSGTGKYLSTENTTSSVINVTLTKTVCP